MLHLKRLIQYPGMCKVLCTKRFQSSHNPICKRLRSVCQGSTSPSCSSCPPPPALSFPYRGRHSESSSSISLYPLQPVLLHQLPWCLSNYTLICNVGLCPDLPPHSSVFGVLLPTVPPLNSLALLPKHLARPLRSSFGATTAPPPVCLWSIVSSFTTIFTFTFLPFFFADTFP